MQHQEWTLDPNFGRPVTFKIFIARVLFPGNSSETAHLTISDGKNASLRITESRRNFEVTLLAERVLLRLEVPLEFIGEILTNLTYEYASTNNSSIAPVCARSDEAVQLWPCSPVFYAPNLYETTCLGRDEICNGVKQCPDGEDEPARTCSILKSAVIPSDWLNNSRCSDDQFACRKGQTSSCIPLNDVCNGYQDCPLGDDEVNCDLGSKNGVNCPPETLFCMLDAKCLPKKKVCDGVPDCLLRYDEEPEACKWKHNQTDDYIDETFAFQSWNTQCPPDRPFFCRATNSCLPIWRLCNGVFDCASGMDESPMVCKINEQFTERYNAFQASNLLTPVTPALTHPSVSANAIYTKQSIEAVALTTATENEHGTEKTAATVSWNKTLPAAETPTEAPGKQGMNDNTTEIYLNDGAFNESVETSPETTQRPDKEVNDITTPAISLAPTEFTPSLVSSYHVNTEQNETAVKVDTTEGISSGNYSIDLDGTVLEGSPNGADKTTATTPSSQDTRDRTPIQNIEGSTSGPQEHSEPFAMSSYRKRASLAFSTGVGLGLGENASSNLMTRSSFGGNRDGEISTPPTWLARLLTGGGGASILLCYGILLGNGGKTRWMLTPGSCGRYLTVGSLSVQLGADGKLLR